MITNEINIPAEFADVCPFNDSEFAEKMAQLGGAFIETTPGRGNVSTSAASSR